MYFYLAVFVFSSLQDNPLS